MSRELKPTDWLIAASQMKGIGRQTLRKILPNIQAIPPDLTSLRQNLPEEVEISRNKRQQLLQLNRQQVISVKEMLKEKGIGAISIFDPIYPKNLRNIPDPPLVLYTLGNLQLLRKPMLSIVGTRIPTNYGKQITFHFGRELGNEGFCIVSGMAKGIDAEAHKGALQTCGGTLAVLGCGIDVVYPAEHSWLYKEIAVHGLIVSEYSPGTKPQKIYFPERNRIVSGFSLGVIVVEASARSGSSLTVDSALEQGRDVFAVPGSILSPQSMGTNKLIKDGAKLITQIKDVIDEYPLHALSKRDGLKNDSEITGNESKLLDIIENTQSTFHQLANASGLPAREVADAILRLQLRGKVKQLPGGFFMQVQKEGLTNAKCIINNRED
ncbi:DNA-processing protein DprA [Ammoniphilus resinae]|uniref:DNA processing protein n=1 Tax=Ammoniphilus resinae TaxID=861532 RepID=A0ABS4GKV2_9BACL|nr:DNA-processing protein DprA [Ammoniphilus resinae]MBP1930777.1 DNA processing protein [Ammoniphilus resinae]